MTGMDWKDILGLAALGLGIYGYVPYVGGILKGKTRPHVFSWLIWGVLTAIGFAAQISDDAGPGAWVTGFSAGMDFIIVALALRYGENQITRSDWITFFVALSAIPLWIITKNPLWSVILISVIDALGFWPTFRKSWGKPHEEVLQSYIVGIIKFCLALLALEHLSWVTGLYTGSLAVMNVAFVMMVLLRRR